MKHPKVDKKETDKQLSEQQKCYARDDFEIHKC